MLHTVLLHTVLLHTMLLHTMLLHTMLLHIMLLHTVLLHTVLLHMVLLHTACYTQCCNTPCSFSASGGMTPAATITFKRLASLIAEKQQQEYNKTIGWIRYLLSFSLVRSSVMCLRGARSSYHRPTKLDFDTPLDVALSDGHIPTHCTAPYGPFLSFIFITLIFGFLWPCSM